MTRNCKAKDVNQPRCSPTWRVRHSLMLIPTRAASTRSTLVGGPIGARGGGLGCTSCALANQATTSSSYQHSFREFGSLCGRGMQCIRPLAVAQVRIVVGSLPMISESSFIKMRRRRSGADVASAWATLLVTVFILKILGQPCYKQQGKLRDECMRTKRKFEPAGLAVGSHILTNSSCRLSTPTDREARFAAWQLTQFECALSLQSRTPDAGLSTFIPDCGLPHHNRPALLARSTTLHCR
jgi:hypothetical protein